MAGRLLGWMTAFLLLAAATSQPVGAQQSYPPPGKPITLIVPYPAGGGTDTGARMMAAGLERHWKTSIQVVNRVGAASQVGLTELVRAKPDGMTFAYAVLPTVMTHYLDPKRQAIYTRANFQLIATHYISTMTLAVKSDSPYRTLKDFVEAARANPGKLKVSDSGLLGTPHIMTLMLQQAAGVKLTSVHFGGGPPSVTALLGGHVDALAGGLSDSQPHMRAGSFRVLGVAAEAAEANMPEVPTMRAQGFDVVSASIGAIVAPLGTPANIVKAWIEAARGVVADPDHAKKLSEFGSTILFGGPAEFEKIWIENEARVKPLIEQLQER